MAMYGRGFEQSNIFERHSQLGSRQPDLVSSYLERNNSRSDLLLNSYRSLPLSIDVHNTVGVGLATVQNFANVPLLSHVQQIQENNRTRELSSLRAHAIKRQLVDYYACVGQGLGAEQGRRWENSNKRSELSQLPLSLSIMMNTREELKQDIFDYDHGHPSISKERRSRSPDNVAGSVHWSSRKLSHKEERRNSRDRRSDRGDDKTSKTGSSKQLGHSDSSSFLDSGLGDSYCMEHHPLRRSSSKDQDHGALQDCDSPTFEVDRGRSHDRESDQEGRSHKREIDQRGRNYDREMDHLRRSYDREREHRTQSQDKDKHQGVRSDEGEIDWEVGSHDDETDLGVNSNNEERKRGEGMHVVERYQGGKSRAGDKDQEERIQVDRDQGKKIRDYIDRIQKAMSRDSDKNKRGRSHDRENNQEMNSNDGDIAQREKSQGKDHSSHDKRGKSCDKDREAVKDRDRTRDRNTDCEVFQVRDRKRDRDKGRDRDKDRDRDYEKQRSQARGRDRSNRDSSGQEDRSGRDRDVERRTRDSHSKKREDRDRAHRSRERSPKDVPWVPPPLPEHLRHIAISNNLRSSANPQLKSRYQPGHPYYKASSASASSTSVPFVQNQFQNDGSFMEMFQKMRESGKIAAIFENSNTSDGPASDAGSAGPSTRSSSGVPETNTAGPVIVKRRFSKILKTGMVQKKKKVVEAGEALDMDAWSRYMNEVQKYRANKCIEDESSHPLMK